MASDKRLRVELIAYMTAEEDSVWVAAFTDALDDGVTDEAADITAYEAVCEFSPRLAGCQLSCETFTASAFTGAIQ